MKKEEIKVIVEDFAERRIEASIAVFNKLFLSSKEEIKKVVLENMDKKFNGNMERLNVRMDKQDEILKRLDERLKPFENTRNWFQEAKGGLGWVAGFLTSITLIIGAVIYLIKWLK